MSFNTDWDVDQYRTEHECEEHWQLRRNFMLSHKDKFPEERLVCLAQVFSNVELLGCRYPSETMQLVAHLSEGVADDYREKQKTKLQRTFVKASDAAGARVKGLKRPATDEAGKSDVPSKYSKSTNPPQLTLSSFVRESSTNLDSNCKIPAASQSSSSGSSAPSIESSSAQPSFIQSSSAASSACPPAVDLPSARSPTPKPSAVCSTVVHPSSVRDGKSPAKSSCQESTAGLSAAQDEKHPDHKDTRLNGCEVTPSDHKCDNEVLILDDDDATEPQVTVTKLTKKHRKLLKEGGKDKVLEAIQAGKFGNLVLLEDDVTTYPGQIIARSAACCQIPFRFEYEDSVNQPSVFCKIYLNNELLSSAYGVNKKEARKVAIELGYEKLKEICYVLKIKKAFLSEGDSVVDKNATGCGGGGLSSKGGAQKVGLLAAGGYVSTASASQSSSLDTPLADNIGSKLMRSMGWTGGGLGKEEQGVQEPVRLSQQVNRAGLGLPSDSSDVRRFRSYVNDMLRDYARKDTLYDLVFASDFSSAERAMMHQIARTKGLKSRSFGKGESRHLVISKQKEYIDIVMSMILNEEYSTEQYELLEPSKLTASCPAIPPSRSDVDCCAGGLTSQNVRASGCGSVSRVKEELHKEVKCLLRDARVPVSPVMDLPFRNVEVFKLDDENDPAADDKNKGLRAGPYGKLVLVEEEGCTTPTQIIERSANGCHIPFKYEYENAKRGMMCKLYVNNILVVSATDCSKKKAREIAVDAGIERLRDLCYTLKTQVKVDGDTVSIIKRLIEPRNKRTNGSNSSSSADIIGVSKMVDRAYLGIKGYNGIQPSVFKRKIQDCLGNYMHDSCPYDIVIPPDFSSPERLFVQKTASRYGLRTSCYEVSKRDFLVIGKKQPIQETAEALLRSGGNCKVDSMTTR